MFKIGAIRWPVPVIGPAAHQSFILCIFCSRSLILGPILVLKKAVYTNQTTPTVSSSESTAPLVSLGAPKLEESVYKYVTKLYIYIYIFILVCTCNDTSSNPHARKHDSLTKLKIGSGLPAKSQPSMCRLGGPIPVRPLAQTVFQTPLLLQGVRKIDMTLKSIERMSKPPHPRNNMILDRVNW